MKVYYQDINTTLYLDNNEFYVRTLFPFRIYEISYKEFIEEIQYVRRSEAWKRLTIIEAGKEAGIISEVA